MKRILVVDESRSVRETLSLILDRDFEVVQNLSFSSKEVDLLILGLPSGFGPDDSSILNIASRFCFPVLFLLDSKSSVSLWGRQPKVDLLAKPFNPYELKEKVVCLLAHTGKHSDQPGLASIGRDKITRYLEFPYLPEPTAGLAKTEQRAHSEEGEEKDTSAVPLGEEKRPSTVPKLANGDFPDLRGMVHEVAHRAEKPLWVTIKTFTQLLAERLDDTAFRTRYTDMVGSDIQRMDNLLEALLDFSQFNHPTIERVALYGQSRPVVKEFFPERGKWNEAIRWEGREEEEEDFVDQEQFCFAFKKATARKVSGIKEKPLVTTKAKVVDQLRPVVEEVFPERGKWNEAIRWEGREEEEEEDFVDQEQFRYAFKKATARKVSGIIEKPLVTTKAKIVAFLTDWWVLVPGLLLVGYIAGIVASFQIHNSVSVANVHQGPYAFVGTY